MVLKFNINLEEDLICIATKNLDEFGVLRIKDNNIIFTDTNGKTTNFGNDCDRFVNFANDNGILFNKPLNDGSRFVKYQPNPQQKNTGDCSIRAYCKAEDISWEDAYDMATSIGKEEAAIPDDSRVVHTILTNCLKYKETKIKKDDRITINEFAISNPIGKYILKTHGHVVTLIDGLYYDSWDSGKKKVIAYYKKDEDNK